MLSLRNLKPWFFFNLKTKMQIRGTIVFQQFKAHFFIKTFFFRCNTYLSMYWWKIRSMTLKIRSQRLFQINFAFCTCITKLLHINDFFHIDYVNQSITIKITLAIDYNCIPLFMRWTESFWSVAGVSSPQWMLIGTVTALTLKAG